jgi:hypothetical protein
MNKNHLVWKASTTMRFQMKIFLAGYLLATCTGSVHAGVASVAGKGSREVAEIVLKNGGREITEEALEKTTLQLSRVVEKCGQEALPVCKKYGPKALRVLYDAGDDGGTYLVKAIDQYGDDAIRAGATRLGRSVIREGNELGIRNVARFNDQIVPLMRRYGSSADRAFAALTETRDAQRLLLLEAEKIIPSIKFGELLDVVGKYGQKGLDFIWKNKGPLAVLDVLVTFLKDPEAYINGVKDLVTAVVVGPDGKGGVVNAVTQAIPWSTLIIGGLLFFAVKWVIDRRMQMARGRAAKPVEVIDVHDTDETKEKRA